MADGEHEEGGSPWAPLWYLLGALVFLIVWWLMYHDPRTTNVGSLFIPSPLSTSSPSWLSPGGSWLTTASPQYNGQNAPAPSVTPTSLSRYPRSPWYGTITIENDGGANASNPNQEYLTLSADEQNKSGVIISGWRLISTRTGHYALIGGGVLTPHIGSVMSTGGIDLLPGQQAIVATGRSPLGVSFRENECVGYLEQFQFFTPQLPLSCPSVSADLAARADLAGDYTCTAMVERYTNCKTITQVPSDVSASCSQFMTGRMTYNGCVATHQGDLNFESNTWRLYLNQPQELWNNGGDTIALLDSQGRLVAGISY